MGMNQSTTKTSVEYEDIVEDYDALHKLRRDVFPENYSSEEWRKILRDFVSSNLKFKRVVYKHSYRL